MVFSQIFSIAIILDQAGCCCTIPLRFPSLSAALTTYVIVSISSKLVIAYDPPIGNVSIARSNCPISTVHFPNTRDLLRTKPCLKTASCLPHTNSTSFRYVWMRVKFNHSVQDKIGVLQSSIAYKSNVTCSDKALITVTRHCIFFVRLIVFPKVHASFDM